MRGFSRFAWAVLAANVAVITWGALVRATGSGAGCGQHWPTCRGVVVPRSPALETVIELTHRTTSAVVLVLVLALFVWAWRVFPRGHAVRRTATFAVAFMVLEALLGAALVLFGWVAKDASLARVVVMPLHLTNTLLLLASITLTAAWAHEAGGLGAPEQRRALGWLVAAAVAMILVGITGAFAALGDSLFPATSFGDGLRQDLAAGSHVVLRLRLLHPLTSALGGGLLAVAAVVARRRRPDPAVRRAAVLLLALVAVQLLAGVVNLSLLAPIWMQLIHLVLADLTWVALVVLASAALGKDRDAAVGARSVAAA
jgi:cytochrome c oxidase assembly protein subunit 15